MTELEELRIAYAECSRQRNELLTKHKVSAADNATLREQVRVLREANAILTAEIDKLRYERDLLRIVVEGTAAADELLETPEAIYRLARIARDALKETK